LALKSVAFYNNVNIGQGGTRMTERNVSNDIEAYLKALLVASSEIELQRTELAQRFQVVPSQINYVIKTRFAMQNGYSVMSKRGGGGYIRIAQLQLRSDSQAVEALLRGLSKAVTDRQANDVLTCLVREKVLTRHESQLVQVMLSDEALQPAGTRQANQLRGQLLRQLLNRLRFESERK